MHILTIMIECKEHRQWLDQKLFRTKTINQSTDMIPMYMPNGLRVPIPVAKEKDESLYLSQVSEPSQRLNN